MFSTLVVALLAAAPIDAAPVSTHCDRCSLTGTLLAQADSPPPLPGDSMPEPRTRAELQQRVNVLNSEIRSVDVNWPVKYLLIGYGGYLLVPIGVGGGVGALVFGLLLASEGVASAAALLLTVGAVGLAVGALGVAAIVYAWTSGNAQADAARKRREALILEREKYEDQLRELRRGAFNDPVRDPVRAPVFVTLARF